MGQKVHPTGFRLGPLYTWVSQWYSEKRNYREQIFEDQNLRAFLTKRLSLAGITKIEIKRSINAVNIVFACGQTRRGYRAGRFYAKIPSGRTGEYD